MQKFELCKDRINATNPTKCIRPFPSKVLLSLQSSVFSNTLNKVSSCLAGILCSTCYNSQTFHVKAAFNGNTKDVSSDICCTCDKVHRGRIILCNKQLQKKIVDSNVKIQALKLVSTMKNIATLWTSRKDQKQEKTPKEPVDICWKTISCLLADSLQLVVSHKWTAGQ